MWATHKWLRVSLMTEPPFTLENDPFKGPVADLPVTIAKFDQVLLANNRNNVAAIAFRAQPGALIFQLIIRTRDSAADKPYSMPNIAFSTMEQLLTAGDFHIGARATDASERWIDLPVEASGGGGGGPEERGFGFEYRAWLPLPSGITTLTLWSRWPDHGLPERIVPLDLADIREAAAQSRKIWQ